MPIDPSWIERNRTATNRIRTLANGLNDSDLQKPVGEHWTVAILLAHLAFWDRRVLFVLDQTEQEGKLLEHQADIYVNDYVLPLLAAIPPRAAARLAIETAEALDRRLASFPPGLLDDVAAYNQRWVDRSLHRNEHLDEADRALAQRS